MQKKLSKFSGKTFKVLLFLLNVLFLFSCGNTKKMTSSTATAKDLKTMTEIIPLASIGFIDLLSNYKHISEAQLLHFFKEIGFAGPNAQLLNMV